MRKLSYVMTIVLTAWIFQACHSNTKNDTKETADSANTAKIDSSKKDTASKMIGTIEKGDTKFAVEAASGGLTEVALGKIAAEKSVNTRVKNFGSMMVSDHTKANDELIALAKTKNITLPSAPDADDQKTIDDLSKKSGAAFDKAYVDDMVKDHKKDIKAFQDAAKNCADPDLKAFASKTLPVLQKHLDAINTIHDSMK
jgi:putative membrane protein